MAEISKDRYWLIGGGVLLILTAIYILRKKLTNKTSSNGQPTTVGTTNIIAPPRYYTLKSAEIEGVSDNYEGVIPVPSTPYYDGGIMLADVPVETLPTGQQVQFVIYAGAYPYRLSKTNIYTTISSPNGNGGYSWYGDTSGVGSIQCSEVGSQDIYPMSLDTAKAIGMQQDITDLLFVDSEYMNNFNTPITAELENGWYSLSPVNPTVDPTHIQSGAWITA